MKQVGKFILFNIDEFTGWLVQFDKKRKISHIQHHHTWIPSYKHFDGNNHFKLCEIMENSHKSRDFDEIGQNFTTFPDGTIMLCRSLNTQPAGIKFHNNGGICIEHVGDFDIGKDNMTLSQKQTIISLTQLLLTKFNIRPSENTIVYHHWFDLSTGQQKPNDEPNSEKTCPGTNFFGGNTIKEYKQYFLPLFKY